MSATRSIRAGAIALALSLATVFAPAGAHAEEWPARPVKLIVPFPPGGLADLVARPLADKLTLALGQPVVVENRGGASGTLGTAAVAAAEADGYTLLFTTANEVAVAPLLYKHLRYDPEQSFTPVAAVVDFSMVLVTAPDQPDSVGALVAEARQKPGEVAFASSGVGTTNHLSAELFRTLEGISILHAHYKGGGPAMTDVAAGHVQAMFATLPSALGLIAGGKLKPLAVTSAQRSPVLPQVPTMAEAGGRELVVTTWAGVLGPKGLPPAIVARLNAEVGKVVASADFRERMARAGAEPRFSSAAELAGFIRRDHERWGRIIADAGIEAN